VADTIEKGAAMNRPMKTFAVYSRPHPLARPRVWIPLLVAIAVTLGWAWWRFIVH
jgi:hypothetical protein